MLSPAQEAIFQRLSLNSTMLTACLLAERVKSFRACLALFCPCRTVRFNSCLGLIRLMASTCGSSTSGSLLVGTVSAESVLGRCSQGKTRHKATPFPLCGRGLRIVYQSGFAAARGDCEHTQPGMLLHHGPYSAYVFGTSGLQRVGPRHSLSSGFVGWMFLLCALHRQFCCPDVVWDFATGRWTPDKRVGHCRSYHIP